MTNKRIVTPGEIVRAELEAEQNRQSFLLRTYKAGDPRRASVRRVVGVQRASRPSEHRARGGENLQGPRSSAPGSAVVAIGVIALLAGAMWLALGGLIWLAIQLLRWVWSLLGGGVS